MPRSPTVSDRDFQPRGIWCERDKSTQ